MRTGISATTGLKTACRFPPDESFYTAGDDRIADAEVMAAALPMLAGDASMVLIHLDQVDYAGHHEGRRLGRAGMPPPAAPMSCWRDCRPADPAQDTLLVLSDHGHVTGGMAVRWWC